MSHRIYLCSRVSYDARELNTRVATNLRNNGFNVYVPHEEAPNNLSQEDIDEARFDVKTIFEYDFKAMANADACVVVGRIGKDCSFEIGWFFAQGIPIFHVPAGDETYKTSPMLLPALATQLDLETAGRDLKHEMFRRSARMFNRHDW